MYFITNRLIIALLCLTVLAGCTHRGDDSDKPYVPISDSLKKAFNYKVGNYWVYRDSLTGNEDSFYVVSNNNSINNGPSTKWEAISISIWSKPYYQSADTPNIGLTLQGTGISIDFKTGSRYENTIFSYSDPIAYYPFDISAPPHLIKATNQNIAVLGNSFSEIAQIEASDQRFNGHIKLYVNISEGMVKIEASKNTFHKVWELERWHIEK